MRSNSIMASGVFSTMDFFMPMYSPLPTMKGGREYILSSNVPLPSPPGHLYSTTPTCASSSSSSISRLGSFPVIFCICAKVYILCTFIVSATSAISSVTHGARP